MPNIATIEPFRVLNSQCLYLPVNRPFLWLYICTCLHKRAFDLKCCMKAQDLATAFAHHMTGWVQFHGQFVIEMSYIITPAIAPIKGEKSVNDILESGVIKAISATVRSHYTEFPRINATIAKSKNRIQLGYKWNPSKCVILNCHTNLITYTLYGQPLPWKNYICILWCSFQTGWISWSNGPHRTKQPQGSCNDEHIIIHWCESFWFFQDSLLQILRSHHSALTWIRPSSQSLYSLSAKRYGRSSGYLQ